MFELLFTIVPIFVFGMFILTFVMIFSPKARSWFVGKQLKAQKQILKDNQDILKDLGTTAGSVGLNVKKSIYDTNDDTLRNLAQKDAELLAIKAKKVTKAIREGLTEENMYCKHCGKQIDTDSVFCKKCGKEQ